MKLKNEFNKRGIPVQISTGRITDMMPMINQTKPDLVVATAVVKRDIGIPLFNGVPLLSGIGLDMLYKDVFECVDSIIKKQP
jgi:galactitol-specific phosphotransferase system IIB component